MKQLLANFGDVHLVRRATLVVLASVVAGLLAANSSTSQASEGQDWLSCLAQLDRRMSDEPRIVAVGHAYGRPGGSNIGLDPKLASTIPDLRSEADVIALTGDVTRDGSAASLKVVKEQLGQWRRILVAPGNHDVGTGQKRTAFTETFGQAFGRTSVGDSAVIWLDTDEADQAISTRQMKWLRKQIRSGSMQKHKSLIVFTHHLVWANSVEERMQINAGPRDPSWARDRGRLHTALAKLDIPVVVISGDTGAWPENAETLCRTTENVTYLASGIGGYEGDSALLISTGDQPGVRVCPLAEASSSRCDSRSLQRSTD